jgi:uncharacterized protein with NRDE domain
MCTLIVLDRLVPGTPLVVASNRDEFQSRPAAPPTLMYPDLPDCPAFVAPQDLEAGGTWMGLNARGLFAGLTNRPPPLATRPYRSRGLLVRDALGWPSAAEAAGRLRKEVAHDYSPFHLLLADGKDAFLFVRAEQAALQVLEPGRHVICNRDPGDTTSRKVDHIRRAVDAIDVLAPLERVLAALARILRGHPEPTEPQENPCVHTPGYGTRSSTLIAVGARSWLWHAEGPPCEAKYRNLSRLLDALRQAPPSQDRDIRPPGRAL